MGLVTRLCRQSAPVVGAKRWRPIDAGPHRGGGGAAAALAPTTTPRTHWRVRRFFPGPSVPLLPGVASSRTPFAAVPTRPFFGGVGAFSTTPPAAAAATAGPPPPPTTAETTTGEEAYQQATELLRLAREAERGREQERSQKMYEAWKQSEDREQSAKTQGVKVIKTLVRETRRDQLSNSSGGGQADAGRRARELLTRAAHVHSHPEASVLLGNMLLSEASAGLKKKKKNADVGGADVRDAAAEKRMVEEAAGLFRRAGEAGSRVGWYNLGQLLWTGFPPAGDEDDDADGDGDNDETVEVDGRFQTGDGHDGEASDKILPDDMHEAMEAFTRAIDLGDGDAMYLVGVHRITQGGRENYHSGTLLIRRAAEAGHGGALYYLALLHLNGEPHLGMEPCSSEEFKARLDRAVEAGSSDARFTRGHSYYHGTEGYPQDFRRALDDFLQAADEGHADSAVSAGAMLHSGVGVLTDQRRAFELYQLAGELGSEEGWANVIDCWRQGLGVPKSEDTARHIEETMLSKKGSKK